MPLGLPEGTPDSRRFPEVLSFVRTPEASTVGAEATHPRSGVGEPKSLAYDRNGETFASDDVRVALVTVSERSQES